MLKHVMYCRKSSEDEDRQALSIDAQLRELNHAESELRLSVCSKLHESMSAKAPGRPVFNEMLRRIEAGEVNAILCWALHRLARNFEDAGRIIGLLQCGAIQEIRTIDRVYLPSDNVLMMALEFAQANQYVRDLTRDIRRGIREKIRRGVFCGKAPLGYFNHPKLRTIEPDPHTFIKVKAILEKFATGNYTMTGIRNEMTAIGLIGSRSGKPLPLSSMGRFLNNPFYYGVFVHNGEVHQGAHVPMISKQTFDDIQKALVAVGRPRKRRGDKGFLFLDFAACGCCGYAITAERHTKRSGLRFDYYRCTDKNKKVGCTDRNFVRAEKFAQEVKRNTALVALPDEWKERYLARIETWEGEMSETRRRKIEECRSSLDALKAKLQRINTAFADGGLDLHEFKELKNPLVPQKVEVEQQLIALEKTTGNRLEPLKNWVFEANQAQKWVSEENYGEMKSFLKKVGSNRLLRAETLTVSFTKPWNSLAETVVAVRDTSDASLQSSKWWSLGESNP